MLSPGADGNGGHVEDKPRPPINEIVISVAVAPQPVLSGPNLPDILGRWFQDHPRVQTALRYEMPVEAASGLTPGPGFQVVLPGQAEPRYWLMSEDEHEIIQVQPNYIALNWRRRDMTQDYPGYEVLRQRFIEVLETVDEGLRRHQGALQPLRAEITYIDVIQPNAIWSSHSEVHRVFNISLPDSMSYERLSLSFSQAISLEQDHFVGRIHINLQPSVDWLKQESQLSLNVTGRSADLTEQNINGVIGFLNVAHEHANQIFLDLLTDRAGEFWGLK
jgi:uncharacterized protein (TIGR04255 family)